LFADLRPLRALLNIRDEATFKLVVTWMAYALIAGGIYPVLAIAGPAGAAKSTFTALLKRVLDPTSAPTHGAPHSQQDLVAIAKNNHVIALDNLSNVSPSLADNLCRLATGGSFGGRQLYTDNDMAAFHAKRPVILKGINDLVTRGDLADRAIVIHLERIDPRQARSEDEIWAAVENAHPAVLAGLLEIVAVGLQRMPHTQSPVQGLPRMVDFAKFGMASAPALGWSGEEFILAYTNNRRRATDIVIEHDVVAVALIELVTECPRKRWSGTPSELLQALQAQAPSWKSDATFPKSAPALGKQLERLKPALEAKGLIVVERRTSRQRIVTLELQAPLRAAA
jgi:hypothetical protein